MKVHGKSGIRISHRRRIVNDRREINRGSSYGKYVPVTRVGAYCFLKDADYFPVSLRDFYSGVVLLRSNLESGTYKTDIGYRLRIDGENAGLLRITGIDRRRRVLNAESIKVGLARYVATLDKGILFLVQMEKPKFINLEIIAEESYL